MKLRRKIFISLAVLFATVLAGGFLAYRLNNVPLDQQQPDYFTYYKTQDRKPFGKVGIYAAQMIMPERFDEDFYYNVYFKPLRIIPWPIRELLKRDEGMPLYDAVRYFEMEEFEPTRLIDYKGRDTDIDGISYVEKYKAGKIQFVPGEGTTPGYFIYPDRKAGIPTRAAELMAKARAHYYDGGLAGALVPHRAGLLDIVSEAMDLVEAKYGPVEWRLVNSEKYDEARAAMRELLDSGVDTVVLAPPRLIYSHYEEFTSSITNGVGYVEEWERETGKDIKVIIAPQMGDYDITRQAHLNMLRERLVELSQDKSVKIVLSFHGMPWNIVPGEAWLELAPPYRDGMVGDVKDLMASEFDFARWDVVLTQEHFSEMTDLFVSTNEALWSAVREGYDYVINVPFEFLTENTDTLFIHARVNFLGFDEYDVYETIDYSDWTKPFVRVYEQDGATVIYNGVPVGAYKTPIVRGYFSAVDSILSTGLSPIDGRRTAPQAQEAARAMSPEVSTPSRQGRLPEFGDGVSAP